MNIEAYIALAALKPETAIGDIEKICHAAAANKFSTVCVPPQYVKNAKMLLKETGISIATVIGFPFGYSAIEAKVAEIVLAVIDGTDEVELAINTGAIKNNDWQFLATEINTILPIVRSKGKKLTVILETGLLTEQEISIACDMYGAAGIDAVKAGTGFTADAAIIEHVNYIRKHLADAIPVKTGVIINNYSFARALILAGAVELCCENGAVLKQEILEHQ